MAMSIKEMRAKSRMSQSKFAKITGIPAANIARWEQGRSKPPEYVERLIEFYLRQLRLL